MKDYKTRLSKFNEECESKKIVISDKKKNAYSDWSQNRKPGSPKELHDNVKKELANLFMENKELKYVYIFGSYYNGDYINSETLPAYVILKEDVMLRPAKISDIDVFSETKLNLPKESIIQLHVVKSEKDMFGLRVEAIDALSFKI